MSRRGAHARLCSMGWTSRTVQGALGSLVVSGVVVLSVSAAGAGHGT